MSSKYNRSNFIDTTNETGTLQYDFLNNSFSKFKFSRKTSPYRIAADDINPRMISLKVYGTYDYWWIILAYNNILDVYTEIVPGNLIEIPDIRDIEDFYNFNKKVTKHL